MLCWLEGTHRRFEGAKKNLTSYLSIPSRRADLGYLIRLPVGDDALLDVVRVNQVFPRLVIKVKDGLVFLDALCLDLGRWAGLGSIYSWRLDGFNRNLVMENLRSVGTPSLSLPIPTDPSLIKKLT